MADQKPSTRTWKAKLKEWKFEKYLRDKEKTIVIGKGEKRTREAKEALVFRRDRQARPGRLANFKRRKSENGIKVVSPSAGETTTIPI
jgi:hypothetical protein